MPAERFFERPCVKSKPDGPSVFGLIFGALAPVFGLVLLGYGCGRLDLLGEHAFEVLNRFVLRLALPVLTFRTLAHVQPAQLAKPAIFIAVLGGSAVVYVVSFLLDRRSGQAAADANIIAVSACYGNTAFVGLPICLVVFGPSSMAPTALVIALNAALVFGFAVAMSEIFARRGHAGGRPLGKAVWAAASNPVVLSAVIGIVWAATGWQIPRPLDVFAVTLGGATAPCALVAVGLFIAPPQHSGGHATMVRTLALKLAVQPLATMVFLLLLPPVPRQWAQVAILLAAMPTGTSSFMIAASAGQATQNVSARAIVLSTLLALPSLCVVLWLLRVG